MIHHVFDPNKVEFDITSKDSCDGIRTTLVHTLTGYRFECLSSPNEADVLKDIQALRSDAICALRCIFVDFLSANKKAEILKEIRTAADKGIDEFRPLRQHQIAKQHAARLGSAIVSAALPLLAKDDLQAYPKWIKWDGCLSSTYGRPDGVSFNSTVAVLTRSRRIFTAQAGQLAWRHHDNSLDVIAYSTDADVILVARDYFDGDCNGQ